jgi:hypothetical protein
MFGTPLNTGMRNLRGRWSPRVSSRRIGCARLEPAGAHRGDDATVDQKITAGDERMASVIEGPRGTTPISKDEI